MDWGEVARGGHSKELMAFFRGCEDIHSAVDEVRSTPLHYAAVGGHVDIVKSFTSRTASVDPHDKYGRTPLYMAVLYRHEEVASVLLDNDADPNLACQCGTTTVSKAAEHGDMRILELLLKKGARTQTENLDGETPEYLAWHNGHDEATRIFRRYKTERLNKFRQAARKGSVPELKQLLDCEVGTGDRDRSGSSALDLAAENGRVEAVRFLLEVARVNPNDAKHRHTTALHRAAREGYEEVVNILLRHGARLDVYDKDKMTPLHRAAAWGRDPSITTICRFMRNSGCTGVTVDVRGPNGVTPLMLASRQGRITSILLLLDFGADASLKDWQGETAREKAYSYGHINVMKFLP